MVDRATLRQSLLFLLVLLSFIVSVTTQGGVESIYRNIGNVFLVRGSLPVANLRLLDMSGAFLKQAMVVGKQTDGACVNLVRVLIKIDRLGEANSMPCAARVPPDQFLALEMGEAYWKGNNSEAALRYWRSGVDLDLFFALRGQQRGTSGDLASALADYRISWLISSRAHPAKGGPFLSYCELLRKQGDLAQAAAVCQRARESGNTFWADLQSGIVYMDQHDFATAEMYFTLARDENPRVARAHLWLGLSLANQGRLKEAIGSYQQGLALAQDDGWLNYLMGKALWDSGAEQDAKSYLRKSIENAPNSWESSYLEEARQLLGQSNR